jgi:thymidylate synthase
MQVIRARNVNDAFYQGITLLKEQGVEENSRAGRVLVFSEPVTTVYFRPTEKVLFHSGRDANPFFHLMESLWMLAGWNDATWLDQFVKDFSSRFAEADGRQHGAYGYRWRHHFDVEAVGELDRCDQLDTIVHLLQSSPTSRQIVLTMWDPVSDLEVVKKDIPCNTQAYFRVVSDALDMMVSCRSNDIIWGCYGANAVHFAVLLEYLAARAGLKVGRYYQCSWNYHAYQDILDKLDLKHEPDPYQSRAITTRIVDQPDAFDDDLKRFMDEDPHRRFYYKNSLFAQIADPMRSAYRIWREGDRPGAISLIGSMPSYSDWKIAAEAWMWRRVKSQADMSPKVEAKS